MRKTVFALAFLFGLFARPLAAQHPAVTGQPTFLTFVDTTNIAAVAPNTYITWIFALSSPKSLPSSAILVAFDCEKHKVARLAHVVYHAKADSSGIEGPIEEDPGTWVDVSVPTTFNLVCSVGSHRPYTPQASPDVSAPKQIPLSPKLRSTIS